MNFHRLPAPVVLMATLLVGCSTPLQQASDLGREGRFEEALRLLEQSADASGKAGRALQTRLQAGAAQQRLAQAERLRAAGKAVEAAEQLAQLLRLDPAQPRALALQAQWQREDAREKRLLEARRLQQAGQPDAARSEVEAVLREAPQHAGARALLAKLRPPVPASSTPPMSPIFARPVSLEFRDAPLRSVFEALTRSHGLNVVFDKDVRADTKVTLFLRDVALEEALRLLLRTQALDHKLLNANTVMVYPATAAKQREHEELIARTFYLTHADAKSTLAMLKSLAKVQDIHVDERLNALVLRESPEVVRLVEDLLATIDLPDAEVMIDVEVLEVSSARLDELGLKWPEKINLGVFDANGNASASVPLNSDLRLSARIVNPAIVASLRGSNDRGNTLSNPTIRARNREKAQVHVGEKLPVFTTTSVPNAGVAAAVSYLDVGIKLDVEPSVQLDDEVQIKVALEVSNVLRQVAGPSGSIGYQVGTRRTSTTLRLRDGETQVLAGLMRDEDLRNMAGLPGLSSLPLLGRLFGVQSDTRNKTEIVLLMTPRVLRNLPVPAAELLVRPAGTSLNPGASSMRLEPKARASVAPGRGGIAPAVASAEPTPAAETLELATSGQVVAGGTVSVTLHNRGSARVAGELQFDATLLRNAAAGGDESGRLGFELTPGEQRAFVLRALPAGAGRSTEVSVSLQEGSVSVNGSGTVEIAHAR